MRIGMMLRSLDEKGGIGVYTANILQELLEIDRTNDYVLFYRSISEHQISLSREAEFYDVGGPIVLQPCNDDPPRSG